MRRAPCAMVSLTLYTRRNCHLCDEMKAVVREAGLTLPLALEEVDVDRDPVLARRYGTDVPVLAAGDRELARHRVTAGRLRELLEMRPAGHQDD